MHNIAKLYYESARELGLHPVIEDEIINGFSFTLGEQSYYFRAGLTPFNNIASASIASNKFSTNQLLKQAGIPVANAVAFTYSEYIEGNWSLGDLKFPVVAKPTWDSACGLKVVCNIPNIEQLTAYADKHIKKLRCLSVEEYHANLRSFRVLVYEGNVIGLVERIPAHVIGDGYSSIRTLIKDQNTIRKAQKKTIPTGPITLNEETWYIFKQLGMTIDSVPNSGERVPLRFVCNSTYGGTFKSLETGTICPENSQLAIKAAKVLNLNLVGFDVLCEDLGIPISKSKGYFIEANADPDITIHESGHEGKSVRVSKIMLKKIILKHPILFLYKQFEGHQKVNTMFRFSGALVILFCIVFGIQHFF